MLGLICPIGKVHKESNCLQLKIKFPFIWPCLLLEVPSDENIGDTTEVSVMTYRTKEDPDEDDDQEEDQDGVRRSSEDLNIHGCSSAKNMIS